MMKEQVTTPQYFKIALDIALRIAKGELEEGKKIYGRSVMASEYGVSPETIRRAMRLLADMQVVEIKPKSCVIISSAAEARQYISRFGNLPNIRALRSQLKNLMDEHTALGRKINETVTEITRIDERMAETAPFPNYEVQVTAGAHAIGKSLGELRFWEATGATVIAIRRADSIILSPGPYAQLQAEDALIFVGSSEAVRAVTELIAEAI